MKKNHDALLRTGATALAAAGASTAAHAATVQITFNNSFISSTLGNHLDTDFGNDLVDDVFGRRTGYGTVRLLFPPVNDWSAGAEIAVAMGLSPRDGQVFIRGVGMSFSPVAVLTGLVALNLGDAAIRGGAPTLGWLDVTATGRPFGERGRVDVHRFIFDDASGGAPVGVAHADAAYPEYVPAAVPEPSGLGLLALGAGGLLARRRRAMAA